jgi:CTP synthase
MSKRTKFVFVTGGVVSSIGKGLGGRVDRRADGGPGPQGHAHQAGPVHQRRSGHDVALPARRGLRHRRRRRDRPRSRPLRALHHRAHDAAEQLHHRPHLRGRHLQGAARRVPRRDGAGHPARHRRDQGAHPRGRRGRDIAIVEIGGTVGDIESLPFLEAIRQLKVESGNQNASASTSRSCPFIATAGELKTKPTQHSVKEMREIGIQPDILLCRCDRPLSRGMKEKISLFSNVAVDRVIAAMDVAASTSCRSRSTPRASTRRSPRASTSGRASRISRLAAHRGALQEAPRGAVKIGVVGKYVHLRDSYKSLHEALVHGGLHNDVRVDLEYIDSEQIEARGPNGAARRARRDPRPRRLRRSRAPRGRSRRSATRASTRSRSSASASACSSPSSSTRATCAASPAPTRSSSIKNAATRSST